MEKRNTIQKQLVLEAVFRLADHPTAEEVYTEVVRSHPNVSKATVYRNLSSLSQDGQLKHIRMYSGADRFDHRLVPHQHILCVQCGRFEDVPQLEDKSLDLDVQTSTGFIRVEHDLIFSGICPECAKKLYPKH